MRYWIIKSYVLGARNQYVRNELQSREAVSPAAAARGAIGVAYRYRYGGGEL